MANEKMKIPQHCGKEMKYVRGAIFIKDTSNKEVKSFYTCRGEGCKHEEILTSVFFDHDSEWLKRGAEVVKKNWDAIHAKSEETAARQDALFKQLREREEGIKSIMDRHREREKMGFFAHLFAKD
jgi:hypothetical protein